MSYCKFQVGKNFLILVACKKQFWYTFLEAFSIKKISINYLLMDDLVPYDLKIFPNKEFFGFNPSSADNQAICSVPLLMNHGVQ